MVAARPVLNVLASEVNIRLRNTAAASEVFEVAPKVRLRHRF